MKDMTPRKLAGLLALAYRKSTVRAPAVFNQELTSSSIVPGERRRSMRTVLSGLLASLAVGTILMLPARDVVGQEPVELENCGFETGDFDGWTALTGIPDGGVNGVGVTAEGESQYGGQGGDTWVINDGSTLPIDGPDLTANFTVEPFEGDFSAFTEQTGPSLNTLYQDIELPDGLVSAMLIWAQIIRNHAAIFSDPNQEFRVEVRDTDDNVLEELFSTDPGDPLLGTEWEEMSADLSDYIGETIRIAFVEEDNLLYFNVHLDEACVEVVEPTPTPSPTPTPAATQRPNLGAFIGALIESDQTPVPQQAVSGVAISPPNTGDAGLAATGSSGSASLFVIAAAVAFVLAGFASFGFARR
jgi:hypothetical protein